MTMFCWFFIALFVGSFIVGFGRKRPCEIYYQDSGVTADCSYRHFTDIPPLPANTTILNMTGNSLKILKNGTFTNLTNLQFLNMSNNTIKTMEFHSFEGLGHLTSLDLSTNFLELDGNTYKSGIFRPLVSLVNIALINNIEEALPRYDYPSEALSDLESLENLTIDGIPMKTFGQSMSKLVNLSTLLITGGPNSEGGICSINMITSDFFDHITHLTRVTLVDCNISTIYADAFAKLVNISYLNITWNTHLKFSGFANVTAGLQNTPINTLDASGIHPRKSLGTMLKLKHTLHMRNLTLDQLYIGYNSLEMIEDGVLVDQFPRSLRRLGLDGNRLIGGPYLNELSCLPHLRILSVNHQSNLVIFPGKDLTAEKRLSRDHYNTSELDMCGMSFFSSSLEKLYVSNSKMRDEIRLIHFSGSGITYIDLSKNSFFKWIGPVTGVSELKNLDLSENYCVYVNPTFFDNMTGLEILNLDYNRLYGITDDKDGKTFSNLKNLKFLKIAHNKIHVLPRKIFKNLRNLSTFNFHDNSLYRFDVDLSATSLTVLDLTANAIQWISTRTRKDMDKIGSNLTLKLLNNSFKCVCHDENMKLLEWFYTTKVKIEHLYDYRCYDIPTEPMLMREMYPKLKRECGQISTTVIILSASGGALLLLLLISTVLSIKYRWKLRYLYYLHRAKNSNGYASLKQECDVDINDAFISYADEDRKFVTKDLIDKAENEAELKLCIRHRDFMAGIPIQDNIVNALQNCKWMVVVLTPSYVASRWCMLEFNLAREECIYNSRGRILIVVEYRSMNGKELPPVIQQEIELNGDSCYMRCTDSSFWEHMIQALKSNPK